MADQVFAGLSPYRNHPRFVPLTPKNWPQDTLRVPNGYGDMTPISKGNIYTGREAFVFAPVINDLNIGVPKSVVVNIDSYGDFWCTNIALSVYRDDGSGLTTTLHGTLEVQDITTGYQLFSPNVSLQMLAAQPPYPGTPFGFKGAAARSTMPQPYPFLRDGGIKLTFGLEGVGVTTFFVAFVLEGWREYQHAAE